MEEGGERRQKEEKAVIEDRGVESPIPNCAAGCSWPDHGPDLSRPKGSFTIYRARLKGEVCLPFLPVLPATLMHSGAHPLAWSWSAEAGIMQPRADVLRNSVASNE